MMRLESGVVITFKVWASPTTYAPAEAELEITGPAHMTITTKVTAREAQALAEELLEIAEALAGR